MSTLHPLFLLKESINKYKMEEKPLYIACLDSEKAYDSVWRAGLFYKLMNNITNQFWYISRQYYNQSIGYFKIDGIMEEEEIVIERGVKQGGVLSPQLFNFYINDLLERIQNTGLGIRCGNTNLPIMGYCDDMQILANLISELQKLVDMCNEYSKKWLMKFNVNKSMVMNVGYKVLNNEQIKIKIDNVLLPVVNECKYLGLKIREDNEDDNFLMEKFRNIQKCAYSLNSYGLKPIGVNPEIKSFIYNTYCQPVGNYGLGILNLKKKTINQANIIQNNLIRYMMDIPYKSHITNLNKVLKIIDVETLIDLNKCTIIKLLHRHDVTKEILESNINAENENWWLYKDMRRISNNLNIYIEKVIYYPDKVRDMILERYYSGSEIEINIREEIDKLIKEYSFKNKKKLRELLIHYSFLNLRLVIGTNPDKLCAIKSAIDKAIPCLFIQGTGVLSDFSSCLLDFYKRKKTSTEDEKIIKESIGTCVQDKWGFTFSNSNEDIGVIEKYTNCIWDIIKSKNLDMFIANISVSFRSRRCTLKNNFLGVVIKFYIYKKYNWTEKKINN